MKGEVGVLNVGAGDTKLSFDKSNPRERERAAKIVADMITKGYALLVQVDEIDGEPIYRRAKAFDPETCEYIVAGGPDDAIDIGADTKEKKTDGQVPKAVQIAAPAVGLKRKPGRPPGSGKRIPAERTRAISVSRTAGG